MQKNTFLQLRHYTKRIYLTLLSTTCVKIHQINYVIFETISYFSRHNSSVFFELKNYILSTKVAHQSANFLLLALKFTKFIMSFFKQKVSFSSNLDLFSVSCQWNSSVLFYLTLYMLLTKVVHQNVNFQICYCSHQNSSNASCHFWNQESVFLQTLHHSSVSWDITSLYFFI